MKKSLIALCLGALLLPSCGKDSIEIPVDGGKLTVQALRDDAIRVRQVPSDAMPLEELIYTLTPAKPKCKISKNGDIQSLATSKMSVEYSSLTGLLTFKDAGGNILLEESYRAVTPSKVQDADTYSASVSFLSPEGEHLFGAGHFQDEFLDVRGVSRRLIQVNTQISIPMFISNKGYGLLWHNYSLIELNQPEEGFSPESNQAETWIDIPEDGEYSFMISVGHNMCAKHYLAVDGNALIDYSNHWAPPTMSGKVFLNAGRHFLEVRTAENSSPTVSWRKITDETHLCSPVSSGVDYTVFAGGADQVMHSFRSLSGHVPQMPDWAFRYIHCRERYATQDQLLTAARRFHEEGIPVGTIVQDWQYWGKYGWNAMEFDEDIYPDPKAMVDEVHDLGMHIMLSVWSKVDKNSKMGKVASEKGYYIENSDWIDFFNPQAANFYWENMLERLVPNGFDAWWQDATEPENDDLKGRRIGPDGIPGEIYRNVFPLKVVETVYNGLRKVQPERSPVILTRSGFAGMQRFGTITWSGDVGHQWGDFRRQIIAGLGQNASGLPWWTCDAGGFFRPDDQYTNADYQECMIRWIQAAVYMPFMRVHGCASRTEPWEYPAEIRRLFEKAIDQRESLQPYILKCAKRVSEEDYTMMRPLIFDFPEDSQALLQKTEYMFGPDYLVCPVTEPKVSTWKVYLPRNEGGWEDCRTGEKFVGGLYYNVPVDMEAIPVFKRL